MSENLQFYSIFLAIWLERYVNLYFVILHIYDISDIYSYIVCYENYINNSYSSFTIYQFK